jgi:hypothetical protein
MNGDMPDLGPCCMCGAAEPQAIVMLSRRAAVPDHGWGCVVWGLPPDGAVAVLCDPCFEEYHRDRSLLALACRGHPGEDGRIAIADLPPGEFDHDMSRHEEES